MWKIRNLTVARVLVGAVIMFAALTNTQASASVSRTDASSHPHKAPKVREAVNATKNDNGSTIHMAKGGLLAVHLEWTPGTGYSWTLENPAPERFRPHGKPVHETAKKPMPGAPEMIVFNYEAIKEGSSTLKYVLKRPFEKDIEPVDRFILTVEVSEKQSAK